MATKKTTKSGVPGSFEGSLVAPPGSRFAVVAARFNGFIVEQLVQGALDGLRRHGVEPERISVVRVPGAREISQACLRLARSKKFDAIVALGAVIRGATAHFDYVAGDVSKGVSTAALETGVPIAFGVITCDTLEQAIERAGTKAGNKGFDAALTAIEMVNLGRALDDAGL